MSNLHNGDTTYVNFPLFLHLLTEKGIYGVFTTHYYTYHLSSAKGIIKTCRFVPPQKRQPQQYSKENYLHHGGFSVKACLK
jgi:hypothetical protein